MRKIKFKFPKVLNKKYGKLTPISQHTTIVDYTYKWDGKKIKSQKTVFWVLCKCECGNQIKVRYYGLINGSTKTCGCSRITNPPALTHGMSQGKSTEYHIWANMKARCTNPNFTDGKKNNYGARGIKICDRWMIFENFIADMGRRPSLSHSLDRIDNNGNYEPKNCRWATRKEQLRNTRKTVMVTYNGKNIPLIELCERLKIDKTLIYNRLKRGMDIMSALNNKKWKR